ncbi:MAG: glycosyltransferase [Bacteroidetes bacterium]|nr:glycosyltransferase [Bacteroidota bacterium]
MITEPLVSICIPSYNSEKYLQDTISSVLNQTYQNFELLITDDCSSDKTVDIIRSHNDNRLKYHVNATQLGVEGNWNKAVSLASGKYIKLLHADDIIYPDCISEQVRVFENDLSSKIVLVSSHKNIINEDGKVLFIKRYPGKTGHVNGIEAIKKSIRFGTNIIGEPGIGLIKAEVLAKSGLYCGNNLYMIDFDLWKRILLYGDIFVINNVLFGFRISKKSISTSLGFSQFTQFKQYLHIFPPDNAYGINRMDKILSMMMAYMWGLGRNLIYFINFKF